MSFILDALKKSEAERNRQSGPTLIDMRIAPPRRRLPVWIIALTVILLANFAVLAIVLLRSPAAEPAASASASASGIGGDLAVAGRRCTRIGTRCLPCTSALRGGARQCAATARARRGRSARGARAVAAPCARRAARLHR